MNLLHCWKGRVNGENGREALRRFAEGIAAWNAQPDSRFSLAVASGTAYADSADKEAVERTEREADLAMYKNKYALKREAFG